MKSRSGRVSCFRANELASRDGFRFNVLDVDVVCSEQLASEFRGCYLGRCGADGYLFGQCASEGVHVVIRSSCTPPHDEARLRGKWTWRCVRKSACRSF